MTIILTSYRLKIVVDFDSNKSLTQIRNFLQNTTLPKIESKVIEKLQANFTTFSVDDKEYQVSELSPNHFQAMARLWLTGDTELTKSQLETGYNNTMEDFRMIIRDDALSQNVKNITWHIHDFNGVREGVIA